MKVNFKSKKTVILAVSILLVVLLLGVSVYFYFFKKPNQGLIENQITHPPCLGKNEIVDFPVNEYYSNERFKYPKFPLVIYIRDKNTNKEKFKFQIDNVRENYISEIYKCGIYVIRQFNYDPQKIKQGLTQDPGYREELWKYDYSGKGESLLLLAEKPKDFISYYDPDFRVDPQEIYVALLRGGYPERPDYALVIRNFNLKVDSFILSYQDLLKKHPELTGYFGLESWTKNGDYFWGDLSIAANEIAYLRILRDIWRLDILPAPAGTLGGTAFNPEYGYITYDTGPGWIGIDVVAEQIYEEWRKAGKKIDFYLYNLFTKEKTLLATIDDPSWSFKPKWISDTELEYEIPNGEKKIYKIEE